MRLRVITATRGDSPFLAATIQSVQALAIETNHILVCPEAVREKLAREHPHCRVVAEEAGGLYGALNTGLRTGDPDDCFTWINDDDVLVASGFRRAFDRLERDSVVGAVYGRVALIDTEGRRLGEIPVAHEPDDLLPLLASGIMPLAQPGTIFCRSMLETVGLFDAGYRLAGDLDYFVRARQAGVRFAFCEAEVAGFRLRAGQLSKDEAAAQAEHARAIQAVPRVPAGMARWRFRRDNLPVYWERLRRHGFKRMHTLYRHG